MIVKASDAITANQVSYLLTDLNKLMISIPKKGDADEHQRFYLPEYLGELPVILDAKRKQKPPNPPESDQLGLRAIKMVVFEGFTQSETAKSLNCSQAHVNRIIKHFTKTGDCPSSRQGNPRLRYDIDWVKIESYLDKIRISHCLCSSHTLY